VRKNPTAPQKGGGDFSELDFACLFPWARLFSYSGFRKICGVILGGKNLWSVLPLGGEISSC
jgi:hypothetical protein